MAARASQLANFTLRATKRRKYAAAKSYFIWNFPRVPTNKLSLVRLKTTDLHVLWFSLSFSGKNELLVKYVGFVILSVFQIKLFLKLFVN